MKTTTASLLSVLSLAATVLFPPASLSAHDTPVADPALKLLLSQGIVSIAAVGPYVEVGTFRVQVAAKLGRPGAQLSDGTWLYPHRSVDGSAAQGTVIVRFTGGRVSSLSIATPAVIAAMLRRDPNASGVQVASRE
jgi:hypothetical protein